MPGGEGGEGGAADEAPLPSGRAHDEPLPKSQLSEDDILCGEGDAIEKDMSFAVEKESLEKDIAWPSRSSATSRSSPCPRERVLY